MPNAFVLITTSFDLHVLSTPPAFVLSQDQTLLLNLVRTPNKITLRIPGTRKTLHVFWDKEQTSSG